MTVLSLQDLANLGLKILARDGLPVLGVANTDEAGWQVIAAGANDTPFDISLVGADIPAVLSCRAPGVCVRCLRSPSGPERPSSMTR